MPQSLLMTIQLCWLLQPTPDNTMMLQQQPSAGPKFSNSFFFSSTKQNQLLHADNINNNTSKKCFPSLLRSASNYPLEPFNTSFLLSSTCELSCAPCNNIHHKAPAQMSFYRQMRNHHPRGLKVCATFSAGVPLCRTKKKKKILIF